MKKIFILFLLICGCGDVGRLPKTPSKTCLQETNWLKGKCVKDVEGKLVNVPCYYKKCIKGVYDVYPDYGKYKMGNQGNVLIEENDEFTD